MAILKGLAQAGRLASIPSGTRLAVGVAVSLAAAALQGCVAEGANDRSNSRIGTAGLEPVGLILVVPDSFQDTNDDRSLDTAQVVVYVTGHAGPRGELLPIEAAGSFVFALRASETDPRGVRGSTAGGTPSGSASPSSPPAGVNAGDLLTTWEFTPEQVAGQQTRLGPGPGFVFALPLPRELQMLKGRSTAELGCVFKSAAGRQLRASRSESIVLGASRP